MLKVLIADQDPTLRQALRNHLEKYQIIVEEAETGKEAIDLCSYNGPYDAAIIEWELPRISGLAIIAKMKEQNITTPILMVADNSQVKNIVSSIKKGAYDYWVKPINPASACQLIMKIAHPSTTQNGVSLNFKNNKQIIGNSPKIIEIYDMINKLSQVCTTVLIRGESGTGKELVAQALHDHSKKRSKGPFVAINCGAVPENLIESELFGHEKGTFTGADRRRQGKFQYASGGTIFLDEIGDISLNMQVKLLRVLQEKVFTPVGSHQDLRADVRIISATNKDLEKMIPNGSFRADLYYRLNVLPLYLPPLRERLSDIEPLIQFLFNKYNRLHHRNIKHISSESLHLLKSYQWPGNIRELENVIEHAFILETTDTIHPRSLPPYIQPQKKVQSISTMPTLSDANGKMNLSDPQRDPSSLKYPILKERFEREFIEKALRMFNGRINQTVEHTQIAKVTLLRKLEKYGISPKEFQQ